MKTKFSARFFIRRPIHITISLMALLTVATPGGFADGVRYSVTDLGTLGGWSSGADGINNNGQIVGCAQTANGVYHAFLWSNGTMTDLGTLGGSGSSATGINNNGQIVGYADTGYNGVEHAFLYSGGVMTDLGTLFGWSSEAFGINNNGQIVGWTDGNHFPKSAFLYSGGAMIDLGTLGGWWWVADAEGINDNGQIVGGGISLSNQPAGHAFLYSGGTMTDLGTLGDQSSGAVGINNNGQIVGWTETIDTPEPSGNHSHAFLYSGGVMTDLGTLGGCWSQACGINNNGQIVGASCTSGNAEQHAFLYSGGVMIDLNSLIATNSGWTLEYACAINDNGQIVGQSTHNRAFLLTPVNPTNQITRLRVSQQKANVSASDSIDAPIVPKTDPNVLSTAADLGLGVVADEVTPVLFKFTGTVTNYTIEITHNANAYINGALADHLYVLQGGLWTRTANLSVSSFSGSCTAFAYLEGLRWTDFNGTSNNEVTVAVNVHPVGDSSVVASTSFLVRPPPIALVHGIADDKSAWSYQFTNTLAQFCPMDFIVPVQYGVGSGIKTKNGSSWPNAYANFDVLSAMLDASLQQQFEAPLHAKWAFTRYNVVGHSQGGVLLRMLCQTDNTGFAPFSSDHTPVVSQDNFFRGRFRRVITIGSPHNGSLNLHYLMQMRKANSQCAHAIPAILKQYVLPKFDPWGSQIKEINNPAFPVNPHIKFNCVITTIANGWPPPFAAIPLCYAALGLCEFQPGTVVTGGELLLPNGSDGVVDFASQGSATNTPRTRIDSSISISHADITKFGGAVQIFGVPPGHSQTTDSRVGQVVTNLLDGDDSAFGSFQLPTLLSSAQKTLVDSIVPQSIMRDMIVALASPNIPTTDYSYALQLPVGVPDGGTAEWFVQVFGTNGISTDGVSLQVNTNDPNQVTVSVTNGVQGQVVLYATYAATNGILVFATPVVVVFNPVGTTLSCIELDPSSVTMSPGDVLLTSIWGDYTNGMQSLLYFPAGQVIYASSNPSVASVDTNGTITLNSFGSATISVSYQGFVAQTVIASVTPSIQNLLVSPLTNGAFQLSFFSTVGTTNVVEASTNLVNWVPVATLYSTNGLLQYLDFTATNFPMRFYRAMMP